jgi:hypothetical protein
MPIFEITGTAYFCDGFAFDDIEARDEAHARERVEELVHERADRHHCLMLNEVCIDSVTMHPEPAKPARTGPLHPLPWRIVSYTHGDDGITLQILNANHASVCTISNHRGGGATDEDYAVARAIIDSANGDQGAGA